MMSFFRKNRIKKSLSDTVFGKNIVYMHVCDSTNKVAKRSLDMPHGTVFIADIQTNGKGRLGRTWDAEKKTGICMSILIKDDIPVCNAPLITLAAGLAVCRAIGCNSMIKWPNDVVIGSKKVCGILTERSDGNIICGIGINVNTKSFAPELADKATSMYMETGEKHDIDYIAALVLNEFEAVYSAFYEGGFEAIREEYRSLCITPGNDVVIIKNGEHIPAYAMDISPEGELVVRTDEGITAVSSGEVSVRGMYGYV